MKAKSNSSGDEQEGIETDDRAGIPLDLFCDRDGCDHVGVAVIAGERLCRLHEMEVRQQ